MKTFYLAILVSVCFQLAIAEEEEAEAAPAAQPAAARQAAAAALRAAVAAQRAAVAAQPGAVDAEPAAQPIAAAKTSISAEDNEAPNDSEPGLKAPAPPVGRQPTAEETCNACRQTIGSCVGYNFRSDEDLEDTNSWVSCMQKSFKKWKKNTGLDYWPDSQPLISGPVGIEGNEPDRVQCFAHVARSPTLPCVPCALFHREATAELDKDSKECWREINKAKDTEEVKSGEVEEAESK